MRATPLAHKRRSLWMSSKSRLKRTARETLQFRIGSTLIITHRGYMLEYCRYGVKHQTVNQSNFFHPAIYFIAYLRNDIFTDDRNFLIIYQKKRSI